MKCKCGKTTNYGNLCVNCSQNAGLDPADPISYEEMLEVIEIEDQEDEEWLQREFQEKLEKS